MRIGLVVPGFSADEQDWCIPALRNLVRHLALGDEVRVVTLRYPHRAGAYAVFGAQVRALGGGTRRGVSSGGLWGAALAALARMHRSAPFDVLHAFWATESGALAALAGRMLGVPVVVSIGGGELVALPEIGYGGQLVRAERVKIRLALRLARAVTAGSTYACRMAEPFLAGARRPWAMRARGKAGQPASSAPDTAAAAAGCVHLPLGVDTELFQPGQQAGAGDPPRLVHAASLVPVKGQTTLLRALALLRVRRVPFVAEIAGAGRLQSELQHLAGRLPLADVLRFRGALRHDTLPGFLQGAAAFVLSSHHEAQCMAVLEAAACGVPTVGSAVGVVPELAPAAALATPPLDHAALAERLAELLADQGRQAAMGAEAARRARADYDAETCAARTREVYQAARLADRS